VVDCRALPSAAFQLKKGNRGRYYEVIYNLGLHFGPELVVTFCYQGEVIETIAAQYQ